MYFRGAVMIAAGLDPGAANWREIVLPNNVQLKVASKSIAQPRYSGEGHYGHVETGPGVPVNSTMRNH